MTTLRMETDALIAFRRYLAMRMSSLIFAASYQRAGPALKAM
jgi:hypothetical protein